MNVSPLDLKRLTLQKPEDNSLEMGYLPVDHADHGNDKEDSYDKSKDWFELRRISSTKNSTRHSTGNNIT